MFPDVMGNGVFIELRDNRWAHISRVSSRGANPNAPNMRMTITGLPPLLTTQPSMAVSQILSLAMYQHGE